MNPQEYRAFLRSSFEEFLQYRDGTLEPDDPPLSYDHPYITAAKWRLFADVMLQGELREVTNRLHDWQGMLQSWHAWNKVVSTKEELAAWALRREFMDPIMHCCLLMPSAVRDLFTFVGTNAFHQIRLHIDKQYQDLLEGDPSPSNTSPRTLTRRQKEARLARLAAKLSGTINFQNLVRKLDDADFRSTTKNYRNTNSHAIGPRIALGETQMITRKVEPATRMERQPDDTFRVVTVPGEYVASYVFGGLEPLDIEAARKATLSQYHVARNCFEQLGTVLKTHADTLPRADS